MIQNSGTTIITTSGAIGTAGIPVRIFGIHLISTGGGASIANLRNGATSGGTIYVTQTGTVSTGATFTYNVPGILFTSGCFISLDANATSCTVNWNYVS